jgi:hypothetical protein
VKAWEDLLNRLSVHYGAEVKLKLQE